MIVGFRKGNKMDYDDDYSDGNDYQIDKLTDENNLLNKRVLELENILKEFVEVYWDEYEKEDWEDDEDEGDDMLPFPSSPLI